MEHGKARRSNYIFEYRIAVLGGACVGKTSLIKRFTEDGFSEKHVATIEDHFQHVVDHHGSTCVCLLIDTSGTFEFPAMKKWSISKANAFVVVYSIADKKSFQQAKVLVDEIKAVKGDGSEIKIVLIGNKLELESRRKVPKKDALDFARDISVGDVTCDFVEVSAKEDKNVTEAFHGLLNLYIPEQVELDSSAALPAEKRNGSFSRTLSLRKKSKKKKALQQKELLRRSDENLLDIDRPVTRQRTYSLETDKALYDSSSDSDSRPSSPEPKFDSGSESPEFKNFRRQSSAKELIRRTTSACKQKLDRAKKKLRGSQKSPKDEKHSAIKICNSYS